MKLFRLGSAGVLVWFWFMQQSSLRAESASPSPLTAQEIIGKAVARSQQGPPAGHTGFTYTKVSVTEEFNGSGKVKERKEKVYEVSFRDGASSTRLLEVNGRAPGEGELKNFNYKRPEHGTNTSPNQHLHQTNRDIVLTPQVAERFHFELGNETVIDGRRTYVLAFTAKVPALPAHGLVERFLDHLTGQLWIDAEEFEIARVEAQLGSKVELLGGIIGSLRKMAYTMTRTRMAEGVWLNNFSSGEFEGRKILEPLHIKTRTEASNFKPAGI
jgi:hypothetical protein